MYHKLTSTYESKLAELENEYEEKQALLEQVSEVITIFSH